MSSPDPDKQTPKLERAGAFAALKRLGAERAVVEFSGGNDEGGPDSITLLKDEETIRTLSVAWHAGEQDKHLLALADALSDPVFEAYGTFAGDFDVTGEVIWDVAEETVQIIRGERSEYQHYEEVL